jgi:serine/threonine kinase PknH
MALSPLSRRDPTEVGGYRLRGRLGSGGMGVVYLATAPDGRPVAVKVMRPELGDDQEFLTRFRREIAAARRVSGRFTAQVLDANPDTSPPWLVTAYVEGPSLSEAVADHGPLPPASVLALLAGMAQALVAIHAAGLVHRDLKPSNVLLAADGPRVIDFGIARARDATSVTRTGKVAGSPHYMAPEQARGEVVGAPADMWALGALGYFAATGRPPFGEGTEAALLYRLLHETPNVSGCPPQVAGIIGACLNRDPAARPSPGRIMEWCQPGRANTTVEYTQGWLPPAVAADVAGRAGPGVTQTPPGAGVRGAPAGPAPRPAQFPHTGVPVHGMPATGMPAAGMPAAGRPAAGRPAAGMPGAGRPMPQTAAPGMPLPSGAGLPGTWAQGSGGRPPGPAGPGFTVPAPYGRGTWQAPPPRRQPSRAPTIAIIAGAVVLAILVGVALYLYGHAHRSDTGYGLSGGNHHTTTSGTSASAVNPCLVGTWIVTLQQVTNTINQEPTQFAGDNGWTVVIQSNGHSTETWSNSELTAEVDGNDWEEVVNGTASYDIKTEGTQIIFSNQSVSGSYKLLENGSYNNGGQLTLEQGDATYSCSGNSFRESTSGGESAFVKAS